MGSSRVHAMQRIAASIREGTNSYADVRLTCVLAMWVRLQVNSIHGDQVSCGTNCATNYPLPVAIGASFNMTLVEDLARMMGMELRALRLEQSCEKHISVAAADGGGGGGGDSSLPDACIGLDTWAPNLNINRDPRWGRNWEVG